ncbi:MAG: hypothetical protein WCQ53_04480 [bacterium]
MKKILIAAVLLASTCLFAEPCTTDQMSAFTNYLSSKVKAIDAKYTKNAAGYYRVSTPSEALEIDELDLINKYYLNDKPESDVYKNEGCKDFVSYCNGTSDIATLNKRSDATIQAYVDKNYTPSGIWAPTCSFVDFYGYNLIACITISDKDKNDACKELLKK